jgi:type II secretory pathway predicted ATPase ExeA
MYLEHYNLKEMPFKISTDPKFVWLGEKHQEALAFLKYGALFNRGFVLITGDLGTGKTTLVNALLERFDKDIIVANVANPIMEKLDFLYCIGHEFNIDRRSGGKDHFLMQFSRFLNNCNSENKKVILIIDEAHRLGQELLDLVELLSNIKRQDKELLNIIFVGQNEFIDIISNRKNLALKQKITINFHINPLRRSEICEYILHRLNIAGSIKSIFTASAIGTIFSFSKGYPRLINIICDHALLAGYVKGVNRINEEIIKECTDEFHLWTEKIDDRKEQGTFKKIKHDVAGEPTTKFTGRIVKMIGFSVLALIIFIILYYPGKFGEHVRKAERYFRESSNGQTKLTSKDMPTIKDSDKNISPVGQDTKKSHETISELQQKQPDVARLAPTLNPLNEERQADYKPTTLTHVKKTKLNGSDEGIQHGLYTIHLHYAREENKELMEELTILLKNKGFRVLGIDKVDYQNSDIRYFHNDDKASAFIIKKHLTQFITSFPNLKNTNIKIKNLSKKYPNAQKGSIELWLNF